MPAIASARFELQGHRGARGQVPENTLPSFEAALDAGVTSIETDLHLSRDGVPVLYHDAFVAEPPCTQVRPGAPAPVERPRIAELTLAELRCYRAASNPMPAWFPEQRDEVLPLSARVAEQEEIDPYCIPALRDLFVLARAYAGRLGEQVGKTDVQRERAARVCFDLELKRVPFFPEAIGDRYDGQGHGLLEQRVVEAVVEAGAVERTRLRSFDHRCVLHLQKLEPRLETAVLVAETALLNPAEVVRCAGARLYCPCYQYLDEAQVRSLREAGYGVLPWTVNDPAHWARLLSWGVSGITTDYPQALARFLTAEGIAF